ncbi:hypothetical protein QBC40DRAFT_301114 [Triangularia verruculosa]|uniref:Uncharacterized protein n=1 Tax=Triangularia verruculosa TaxID=2587418 RepID=A0AAN6X7W4_9PEZI|nr:hypothetical protein QBC40DRAFT_301114 [Triangularia verruculosa]
MNRASDIQNHSSPPVQGADDRAKRTEALAQRLRAADHAGSDAQKEHLKALDPARELSKGLQQAQADLAEFKRQNEARTAKEDKLEKLCRSAAPVLQELEKNLAGKPQILRALPKETVQPLMATAYQYSLLPEYEGLVSEASNRRLAQQGLIAPSAQRLQVQVNTLQSRISAKDAEIQRLQSESASSKKKTQDRTNSAEKHLMTKITALNEEITGLKRKLDFVEIENSKLQDRVGKKDESIASKARVISRQIKELNELAARFGAYQKESKKAAETSEARSAELERDIRETSKDVDSKQRIISRLEKRLDEASGLAVELKELEAQLTAESIERVHVGEAFQKEKQANKELYQQLKGVTTAKQQLEVGLQQLRLEMQVLKSHGETTDASCANLKRQLEDAEKDAQNKRVRLHAQEQELKGVLESLLRHLVAVSGVRSDQTDWVKFAEAMVRPNTITLLDAEMEAWSLQEPWGEGRLLNRHSVAQAVKELYIVIRKQCWNSGAVWLARQFCEALRRDPSVEFSTIEVVFREWKTVTDSLEEKDWTVVIQSMWYAVGHAACVLLERLPQENEAERTKLSDVRTMFASRINSPFLKEKLLGMVSDDDDSCWLQLGNRAIIVEEDAMSKRWILMVDLQSKAVRATTRECWALSIEGNFIVTASSGTEGVAEAVSYPLEKDKGQLVWFIENIL